MTTRYSRMTTLWMLAGSLFVLGAAGCANRQPPPPPPPPTAYARPSVEVVEAPRTFVTKGQQRYYVDSRGGLHLITREVREAPGIGGGLYYIEGDERPYYIDETQRLYYRDDSGRIYYIEDTGPGRVIEPEVILRGERPSMQVAPMAPRESCASQYDNCVAGCRGISPRQSYTRPECMSNCDTIRSRCMGQ